MKKMKLVSNHTKRIFLVFSSVSFPFLCRVLQWLLTGKFKFCIEDVGLTIFAAFLMFKTSDKDLDRIIKKQEHFIKLVLSLLGRWFGGKSRG